MGDLQTQDISELRAALEPISVPSAARKSVFNNWAKTFECRPQRVFEPTTTLQCRQIIELAQREGANVHPVGVGHSPSDLGCTNGWMVRMERIRGLVTVNHEKRVATFRAGTTLHAIHAALAAANPPLALPNIGSISDQTIAGLISTASHGSGVTFPVLSRHVRSLTMILPTPGAPIVRASPNERPDLFQASLCGLGATGMILDIEMEVEEAFRLKETKESKGVDEVIENLDEIKMSAEHVRVWWYPDGKGMVIGRADRTYEVSTSLWAMLIPAGSTQIVLDFIYPWISLDPILPPTLPLCPFVDPVGWSLGLVARQGGQLDYRSRLQGSEFRLFGTCTVRRFANPSFHNMPWNGLSIPETLKHACRI